MKKINYPIGSVSSGTMRAEDLIDAFAAELGGHLRRDRMTRDQRKAHSALYRECCALTDYESEQAAEILSDLFDAMDAYSAPYFYFGANSGDGADYGYWLSENFADDFDGLKVADTSEVPRGYRGEVLYVNDHGNVTLYVATSRGLREVWSVV